MSHTPAQQAISYGTMPCEEKTGLYRALSGFKNYTRIHNYLDLIDRFLYAVAFVTVAASSALLLMDLLFDELVMTFKESTITAVGPGVHPYERVA